MKHPVIRYVHTYNHTILDKVTVIVSPERTGKFQVVVCDLWGSYLPKCVLWVCVCVFQIWLRLGVRFYLCFLSFRVKIHKHTHTSTCNRIINTSVSFWQANTIIVYIRVLHLVHCILVRKYWCVCCCLCWLTRLP